jgi:hypothetical protein
MGDEEREFWVGVGKVAHAKHQFEVGLVVGGMCQPVQDPRMETADFYKVSKLVVEQRVPLQPSPTPPWLGIPPELPVYRSRAHRRLSASTYKTKCSNCMWGCQMVVEMIIDHWNPSVRRYRTETFCYGPKNCPAYRAGAKRKVPGRKGMIYTEEDWVDEDATAHRSEDE